MRCEYLGWMRLRSDDLGNDLSRCINNFFFFYKNKLVIKVTSPSVCRQLSEVLLGALNQNLVQFTLRPGVQVTVYAAHLSAGKPTQLHEYVSSSPGGPLYFCS